MSDEGIEPPDPDGADADDAIDPLWLPTMPDRVAPVTWDDDLSPGDAPLDGLAALVDPADSPRFDFRNAGFDSPGSSNPTGDVTGEIPVAHPTPPGGVVLPSATPRRRWPRRTRRTLLVLATVMFGYYLITLFQVWSTGRAHDDRPALAIVVLGAAQYDGTPSPQLAARLDHALELWQDGLAPFVVVTGGKRPGDRFTEADASAAYLVDRGVPENVIIKEGNGATTYQSLEATVTLLKQPDGRRPQVVLVSDPSHMLRAKMIAGEVGLDATSSSTTTSPVRGWSAFVRHLKEAGGVSVGRIIGFDRLERIVD